MSAEWQQCYLGLVILLLFLAHYLRWLKRAQCFAQLKKCSQQRKHLGVYFQDILKGVPEAKSIKSTMSLTNFKILT